MEAGRLDRRILLYRPVYTRDAANEPTVSYPTPIGPLPARKLDVSDGERVRAQQVGADLTTRFHIRRSARVEDVAATWQIALLRAGAEVARYQVTGKKDLLAHGDHGRVVGFELTALAAIDGAGPPET